MAGLTKTQVQLGDSATATQNFVLTSAAQDGTMKLARGNYGATTQDIMTVDAAGKVVFPSGGPLTSMTAVNSTSGTAIDFTGIPSWAKRITVLFNAVSTSGTNIVIAQIGSGVIDATGYSGSTALIYNTNSAVVQYPTTGAGIYLNAAADSRSGAMTISLLGSNVWVFSGAIASSLSGGGTAMMGATKTLSGALDRVRITTVGGTDTFDAGSINVMYE